MAPLAQLVVTWREGLADYIRAEGKKNGVSIAPRFPEDREDGDPEQCRISFFEAAGRSRAGEHRRQGPGLPSERDLSDAQLFLEPG